MSELSTLRQDFLQATTGQLEMPVYIKPGQEYKVETEYASIVLEYQVIDPPEIMAHVGRREYYNMVVRTDALDIEFNLPAINGQLLILIDISKEMIYIRYAYQAYMMYNNYLVVLSPSFTTDEEQIDIFWINPKSFEQTEAGIFSVTEDGNLQMVSGTEMEFARLTSMRGLIADVERQLVEFLTAFRQEGTLQMTLYEPEEDFDDDFELD